MTSTNPTEPPVLSVVTIDHRRKVKMRKRSTAPLATVTDLTEVARKRKASEAAVIKADTETRTRERGTKCSWAFTTDSKNRFETAVFELDVEAAGWSTENPPRMLTFKFLGAPNKEWAFSEGSRRVYWEDIVPSPKAKAAFLRNDFAARYKSAFKVEFNAAYGSEFQKWGNPHDHALISVPLNADGTEMEPQHATGKGGRYAAFNRYKSFWEWAEMTWADVTGQVGDISNPAKIGRLTHVLQADEIEPAESMTDYLLRFVQYIRKDNEEKYGEKLHQHVVPAAWIGQQVSFWGIIGFVSLRRSADAPTQLECRTKAAENAVRDYFHRLSGAERYYADFDGKRVDISYWSNSRSTTRGGTLNRPLTVEEVRCLRRLVAAKNMIADPVAVDQGFGHPEFTTPEYEPPRRDSFNRVLDRRNEIPAIWDRDDFDVDAYLAAGGMMTGDHAETFIVDPQLALSEDKVRPVTELLELPVSSAGKQLVTSQIVTERSPQFVFTSED